ncbi:MULTISPECIES: hypothetical protein [unclassified Bradyrhizobium]
MPVKKSSSSPATGVIPGATNVRVRSPDGAQRNPGSLCAKSRITLRFIRATMSRIGRDRYRARISALVISAAFRRRVEQPPGHLEARDHGLDVAVLAVSVTYVSPTLLPFGYDNIRISFSSRATFAP